MNRKQKGTESVISLLTAIILCIGRLCCNVGQELTIDTYLVIRQPLDTLERTHCTPVCLAFALLDQQGVSNQGVLQVKLCHCELKAFGKASNHKFLDYGFEVLIGIRMEASMSKIDQEG
jgi:hypothetical protein